MALVDGRTLLTGFESGDDSPDDLSGAAAGTVDTEIFRQGTQSYGYYTTTSRDGLLFDAGTAQDWSNNHFYIWYNTGIAGLLDTKANGGVRIRFCGETVTDFFEVNIAGSDDYPPAVAGGWVMFVVDIEKAKAASDATGGTPPDTTAVRYVGVSTITGGTMPRMADNTWIDAIWRLPANTAGIRVEGQNTGPADWTWADIVAESETNAWGTARDGAGGAIVVNTPIQFGANDAATHGFSDTNKVILWDDWDVAADFYGFTVIGGSGSQSFQAGIKTGTGDDATGAQGWVVSAASLGERWFFDSSDVNVDSCNLYGCQFQHGGAFTIDGTANSFISCTWLDCSSALVTDAEMLRALVLDANTADGVAFMESGDPSFILDSDFEFSDGHALEITSAGTYTFSGNTFTGYGADDTNDAAVFNDSGDLVTLNIAGGGTSPTVRNGAGASTVVNANVSVTLTGLKDNTEVRVYDNGDDSEIAGTENATTGTTDDRTFTFSDANGNEVRIVLINIDYEIETINPFTIPATDTSIPVQQRVDRNYDNP